MNECIEPFHRKFTMLFQVFLPSSLPSIISGANIGIILSFILLTSAEMIGSTSGLGWYVKYFSDYADYPRVIVDATKTPIRSEENSGKTFDSKNIFVILLASVVSMYLIVNFKKEHN